MLNKCMVIISSVFSNTADLLWYLYLNFLTILKLLLPKRQ